MRPVNGRQLPVDTFKLMGWDPLAALTNMAQCKIRGDLKERTIVPWGAKDFLENSIAPSTTEGSTGDDKAVSPAQVGAAVVLRPVANWPISTLSRALIEGTRTDNTPLKALVAVMATKLSGSKVTVPSYGVWLENAYKTTAANSAIGLASTGAGRGMYYLPVPGGDATVSVPADQALIPDPHHNLAFKVAMFLALLDQSYFGFELANPVEAYGKFSVKDRIQGELMVTIERAKTMYALAVLYLMQLPALYLDCQWPFWTKLLERKAKQSPRWKEILDKHNSWDERRKALPRHPWISLLGSVPSSVTALSRFGGTSKGSQPVTLDVTGNYAPLVPVVSIPNNQDEMDRSGAVDDVYKDLLNNLADAVYGNIPANGKASVVDLSSIWGVWDQSALISPYAMIAKFETLEIIREEMMRVKTKLNWDQRPNVGTIEVNMLGADYVITDGSDYSQNPMTGLLGFTPVIGINNPLVTIDDRRCVSTWNQATAFVGDKKQTSDKGSFNYSLLWSVMLVRGEQTITGDGSESERYLIPANEWMGTPDADKLQMVRLDLGSEDPVVRAAVEWYSRWATVISDRYRKPASVSDPNVYLTDWDVWSVQQADPDGVRAWSALVTALGDKNTVPTTEATMYRSDYFPMKFPVRLCSSQTIRHFTDLGVYIGEERRDGHLDFSGEIDITQSGKPLIDIAMFGLVPQNELKILPVAEPIAPPKGG